MTEQEWLVSNYPVAMMRVASGRISRCCGCWWAENGDGTLSMLPGEKACARCDNATPAAGFTNVTSYRKLQLYALACARSAGRVVADSLEGGSHPARIDGLIWARMWAGTAAIAAAERADLLRCIVGNPWQPKLTVVDEAASRAAAYIYSSQDFSMLPLLADALEDMGCFYEAALAHCRSGGPHARGCWVVDMLMGNA